MLQSSVSNLNPLIIVLAPVVFLSAALRTRAESRGQKKVVYITKPLGTLAVLVLASMRVPADPFYKALILAGLVFSLAGDVFLMLPGDRFVHGLVSFLAAHLFYIAAFISRLERIAGWVFLPLALTGFVVYRVLSPGMGKYRRPVIVYIAAIVLMAALAWEVRLSTGTQAALSAAAGAVFFMLSDSVLAIVRFRGKFRFSTGIKVFTYLAAQWLIACSIGSP